MGNPGPATASGAGLKAPFPYFGGKSKIAALVWERLGDVQNYIEPFAGSLAVLLRRPLAAGQRRGVETVNERDGVITNALRALHPTQGDPAGVAEVVNDLDPHLANFWRSVREDPAGVAEYADRPVNELDLHAISQWLIRGEDTPEFRERLRADLEFHDVRRAGWWVVGLGQWIGRSWGRHVDRRIPHLSEGKGVHGRPDLGTCAERRAWLIDWFGKLRDRLRLVRVCCGDWQRVCRSYSTTTSHGLTGVFLDPPYRTRLQDGTHNRNNRLYATDARKETGDVVDDVIAYCLQRGSDPLMRLAVCGYADEGYETLEQHGWDVVAWKTNGGYGNQAKGMRKPTNRERIWFSPHCVPASAGLLFDREDEP